MTRRFFELEDDLEFPGRWHLDRLCDDIGVELDGREFRYGNQIDPGPPLRCGHWKEEKIVEVRPPLALYRSYEGTPLDFTYTDSCMPVATKRVGDILGTIAGDDIQPFPVRVDRRDEAYEIINVVSVVDCLDTVRSEITWFEEGNAIRPDLAGEPSLVRNLMIDADRVGDHHVFRIKGWTLPIIVSEAIKQAFEVARVTGVKFCSVSGAGA
jgi:hypothetical protein